MHLTGATLTYSQRSLGEALTGVAELGFRRVELAAMAGWAHVDPGEMVGRPAEAADALAALLRPRGLEAVAVNANAAGSRDAEIQAIAALAEMAERLGIGVITLQPARHGTIGLERDLDRFHRLVAAARPHGVTLAIEPHVGTAAEDPDVARRYAERVDGLGVTLDPSHFVVQGIRPEACRGLWPHVRHVHAREAAPNAIQVPPGEGYPPARGFLDALFAHGYRGHITVEYIDAEARETGLDAGRCAGIMRRELEG